MSTRNMYKTGERKEKCLCDVHFGSSKQMLRKYIAVEHNDPREINTCYLTSSPTIKVLLK